MRKLFSGMVLLGVMNPAAVQAAGSDELWEMSVRMDMKGMSMPAMTNTSCLPKGGAYKPENERKDKNCEMTDVQVSGNTTKWKMHCSGKDPVDGSGEVTRTADTMNGTIKMSMQGGQMTQIISGKRVGTCDAATERKRLEETALAPMKEVNDKQRAECRKLLDSGGKTLINGYTQFVYQGSACQDMKNAMCDKVRAQSGDYSGYRELAAEEKNAAEMRKHMGAQAQRPLSAECGLDMPKLERSICQKANGEKKYGFLAANCPTEAQTLAKRHCDAWGRDYTSDHDNEYAPICAKYSKNKSSYDGGDEMADEDSDSSSGKAGKSKQGAAARKEEKPSAGDNPVGAVIDGAKKLKGLFNF